MRCYRDMRVEEGCKDFMECRRCKGERCNVVAM